MRLKYFRVENLFGLFDHELKLKTRDRITIIHGPNGVGKTTVLKLIEAALSPRSSMLRNVAYDKIILKFLPAGTLTIQKDADQAGTVHYRYRKGKSSRAAKMSRASITKLERRFPYSMIDEMVPSLDRVGPALWHDHKTGLTLNIEDVFERYGDFLPQGLEHPTPIPDWLKALTDSITTQFIRTQRLQSLVPPAPDHPRRRQESTIAVEAFANDLAARIQRNLSASGSLAASLDRTFPHRLLEGKLPRQATEKAIRAKYRDQQQLQNRLMKAGLLDTEEQVPLPDTELDQSERKVLWYYLDDVNKRLEVYSPLLTRVELFKRIIDDKKFLYKFIAINKDKGFLFLNANGEPVPLGSLSSGEQHEIVLTYELLFKSGNGQLVLIDEPELSLHVLWQQKFLDDMEEISHVADLDFIIATHSPSIVSHRTDLMIELSGQGDD